MSPVVLLLAVLTGSISASTIREYTGGNDVSDIFDHQDNVLDEIEEMPTLPAEFDSEWDNTTNGDMPDMKCMAYFMCMMQNESPEPSGSFKNGFDVTPKFLKKHCRYMKKSLACYYDGEYADCPDVVNFVESLTARYQYMCFQPGKSVVRSMLPCFNKYDVQMSLLRSSNGMTYSMETTMNWPNPKPSDTDSMMCWAMEKFYYETGAEVERHCSVEVRGTYETFLIETSRPTLRHHNCTLGMEEEDNANL